RSGRNHGQKLSFIGDVQRNQTEQFASSANGIAGRNQLFIQSNTQTAIARQFVQRSGYTTSGRIAHPADTGSGRRRQGLHQWEDASSVGIEIGFEIQFATGEQNRYAVIADGSGKNDLVARPNRRGIDVNTRKQLPNSGGADVHLVGLAVFHNLRIATDNGNAFARTSASRMEVGSPSSSTKVVTIAWPRAPDTARSFMVPFTASSPIDPPANCSGFTTNTSVVMAMSVPLMCT